MREFFMKTERLGFSKWNKDDMENALKLWGSADVTKFIAATGKMNIEDIKQRLNREIENNKNFGFQYWPIFDIETDEIAGCCGLRPYDAEKSILELGVHLRKEFWGIGLAQEACMKVISYAFDTLRAEEIFAGHNPSNNDSAKLIKRLGFRYTHDEFYPPTGLNHPSYLLSREEFQNHKI